MTDAFGASPVVRAVGLALVEFLWQGALIGAATAIGLGLLRRASANAQYLMACVGLALMVAAPVATTLVLLPGQRAVVFSTGGVTLDADRSPRSMVESAAVLEPLSTTPPPPATSGNAGRSTWLEWTASIDRWLPRIVTFWIAGVSVLALHLIVGWWRVRSVRRGAVVLTAGYSWDAVGAIARRMGITRSIRLIESRLVDVPAVIGWMRPAIVVPASALIGLPPAHLDAILAHELAHIRRGDYFVNIAQCVAETLLFYHPAVWWVSRQIRIEREHCCDDLAASMCADRVVYASALTSLEELRGHRLSLALGASDGSLLRRIRRLLDPRRPADSRWSGGFAMSIALTVLLFAVSGPIQGRPADHDRLEFDVVTVTAAETPQSAAVIGRISGDVRDKDGLPVAGATVAVGATHVATRVQTTVTDYRGQFAFASVPAGDYELRVVHTGFRTAAVKDLKVVTGETKAVSVVLEVGSLSETLEVRPRQPGSATQASASPSQPRTPIEYFNLAQTYYQQGRLQDAETATMRALELIRAQIAAEVAAMSTAAATGATTEARPTTQVPIKVGGAVQPPRKIKHVEPIYPDDAVAAGVEGVVFLEATISKTGEVTSLKLLRGIRGMTSLEAAAIAAVRQWIYSPTKLNGAPVEVIMTVTVRFRK